MKKLTFLIVATAFAGISAAGGAESFTDKRDGKTYRTVKMPDGKIWMAENLKYQPQTGKSWCYDNKESNCNKYGRLYDWNTARTVCPGGWHLPSRQEWNDLVTAVGDGVAGKRLKSTSGWSNNGNGSDDFVFSALPGGRRGTGGDFYHAGDYGYWWAATEYDASYAYFRSMDYNYDNVGENAGSKENGFSVRCVGD
jgi:uncharacterized protein (TIGR02145 family)